ncbi:unnamed protein product [Protopolystoma xenopodis]|uniref:Uncharacterized protein n=1 Tax=Protopolystoma xenopodis TaxID=117903 RepID=A0A448XFY3_9PLAT|nr:unnamed protein product [Protopolystoma xenopodis]
MLRCGDVLWGDRRPHPPRGVEAELGTAINSTLPLAKTCCRHEQGVTSRREDKQMSIPASYQPAHAQQ